MSRERGGEGNMLWNFFEERPGDEPPTDLRTFSLPDNQLSSRVR